MDLKVIGEYIARKRKEKGYTQEKLADVIGVTSNAISKWERGVNAPNISLLIPLSKVLDIKLEDLLNGCDNSNNDDSVIDGINYYTNKVKIKFIKYIVSLTVFFLFLILIIFFVNNYNKFHIYNICSSNNKYSVSGKVIFNQEENCIIINSIDLKDKNDGTDNQIKIKYLKLVLINNSKVIFSNEREFETGYNMNRYLLNKVYYIDERINTNENIIINKKDLDSMYIEIEYKTINKVRDKIDIPLKLEKEYSNNKII